MGRRFPEKARPIAPIRPLTPLHHRPKSPATPEAPEAAHEPARDPTGPRCPQSHPKISLFPGKESKAEQWKLKENAAPNKPTSRRKGVTGGIGDVIAKASIEQSQAP